MHKNRIIAVDATNIASRLFFSMYYKEKSVPTLELAAEKIITYINSLILKHNMEYVISAFDLNGSDYRKSIYPEYKAGREDNPARKWFVCLFKHVMECYGIKTIDAEGIEADDIIASFITKFTKRTDEENRIVILTSDKDYNQLISPRSIIYFPNKQMYLNIKGFRTLYGFEPKMFPVLQAMIGDKVDNIPRCLPKGIGEVSIKYFLSRYDTMESLLNWINGASDQISEYVKENLSTFELNLKLTTLLTDIDLSIESIDECRIKHDHKKNIYKEIMSYGEYIPELD